MDGSSKRLTANPNRWETLRAYASESEALDHDGLTEKQREAYSWLCRNVPGVMRLEPAKSELVSREGVVEMMDQDEDVE